MKSVFVTAEPNPVATSYMGYTYGHLYGTVNTVGITITITINIHNVCGRRARGVCRGAYSLQSPDLDATANLL